MKKRVSNQDLDRFATQMIHIFSAANQEQSPPSPYFMTRVQARIREMQDTSQFWADGVIGTQRWLVAFSLIALIFLVSNFLVTSFQSATIEASRNESLVLSDQEGAEWDIHDEIATK
jgi:hypothetical protein